MTKIYGWPRGPGSVTAARSRFGFWRAEGKAQVRTSKWDYRFGSGITRAHVAYRRSPKKAIAAVKRSLCRVMEWDAKAEAKETAKRDAQVTHEFNNPCDR